MKENIDYCYVERDASDFYSIKIKTGPWAGVIYTYGAVSIKEDEMNDIATLHFDYCIEDISETQFTQEELNDSADFKNMMGLVLEGILSETEFKIGHKQEEVS
jgi:hypothetical protein